MSVGERLKESMKIRGFTQTALGKKSGVKQSTLSEICKGRIQNPRGDTLQALAAALEVRLEWLASGEGGMVRLHSEEMGEQSLQALLPGASSPLELSPEEAIAVMQLREIPAARRRRLLDRIGEEWAVCRTL